MLKRRSKLGPPPPPPEAAAPLPAPGREPTAAEPEPVPPSPFAALVAEGVVSMGAHSYGEPNVQLWRDPEGRPLGGRVTIGRYCSLAEGIVLMTGGNHRTDWVTTSPIRVLWDRPGANLDGHPASKGDIRIGNDVWIGREALVLSGVTIGDGAVVGARAVVSRDVAPYAIVAGNPAREVRKRFEAPQIEALLRIRWWDWPDERVDASLDLLLSPDVTAFIAAAERYEPDAALAQAPDTTRMA